MQGFRKAGLKTAVLVWAAIHMEAVAQEPSETAFATELAPFAVETALGLNDEPALGLAMPVTRLRFAPGVDLQSRGFAELQSDVTVRGSTFEQTGVLLGTVPLFDPQTGHYAAELPFGEAMLTTPRLLTGAANARRGFNANVASIEFGWAPIEERGLSVVGAGTESLFFGELYQGIVLGESGWAADFSAGHGQGEGTIANGDFRVWRGAARVQHRAARAQTDLAVGWLDKSYAWPGMYTGFASLPETDDYQNLVVTLNHRSGDAAGSFWSLGAVYREMDDDYYYNRNTPPAQRASRFQHLTRVATVAADGRWEWTDSWALLGRAVWLRDELVRSTSLTSGDPATGNDFTRREYAKVSAAGEASWTDAGAGVHTLVAGFAAAGTDQDTGKLSPFARWERSSVGSGGEWVTFAQVTETAQVPGYTALRSPSGLFGGNANLGRELSRVAEVGGQWESSQWFARGAVFFRKDDELVDWTYASSSLNARQANAMDLETRGLELELVRKGERGQFRLSYAFLEKDADYGSAPVDGSFYALNFPRHRIIAGAQWRLLEGLEVAGEGEFRVAEKNARRTTGDEAVVVSFSVRWLPWGTPGVEFDLLIDNLLDDDFQEFPGTPAAGRHGSIRALYRW